MTERRQRRDSRPLECSWVPFFGANSFIKGIDHHEDLSSSSNSLTLVKSPGNFIFEFIEVVA